MLNVVVLPAPFGPMMPTISNSPTVMLTSRAACTPPNRMDRSRASSTDIGDHHLLHATGRPVEALARDPELDGLDELTDAAGQSGQHDEQEHGPDDARRPLRREHRYLGEPVLEVRHAHR